MAKINPFKLFGYDLGTTSEVSESKSDIDNRLLDTAYLDDNRCYVCTSPTVSYQVLAKDSKYETAEIQKGVYVCTHCLRQGYLDKDMYGVREL